MRIMTGIGAAIILLACLSLAQAQGERRNPFKGGEKSSAEEFVDLCQYGNEQARVLCGTAINSVLNSFLMMAEQNDKFRELCPQRRLTDDEARRAFLSSAERFKDLGQREFPNVVMAALKQRYPCTEIRIKR